MLRNYPLNLDKLNCMENALQSPVSYIEGIGDKTSILLSKINVFTIGDLLRTPIDKIYEATKRISSKEDTISWHAMALFLQINEIDNQLAEAIYKSGIKTLDSLAYKKPEQLKKIFTDAKSKSVIPTVPSAEVLFAILHDATVMCYTGKMDGRVLDSANNAVEGVTVKLGSIKAITDKNGYFRLQRIPLRRSISLILEKNKKVISVVDKPTVCYDYSIFRVENIVLPSSTVADKVLDEFKGDKLPSMNGYPIDVLRLTYKDIRDSDIFRVQKFYATPYAQLVSIYRSYTQGQIQLYSYKVPLSVLPESVKVNEQYRLKGGEFELIKKVSPQKREALIKYKKYKSEHPGEKPKNAEEYKKELLNMFKFIFEKNGR